MTTRNKGMSNYKTAYLFDVVKQGIYYKRKKLDANLDFRLQTGILKLDNNLQQVKSSRFIASEDSLFQLENILKRSAAQGRLGDVVFVIGYNTDPLNNFAKFDTTKQLLKLFNKYRPGKLIIQTYSNLVVLALSELLSLKKLLTVNVIIESNDNSILRKYSAGKSLFEERLKTAYSLKTFGFDVGIQVAPLLPLKTSSNELLVLAKQLARSCDHIFIKSIYDVVKYQNPKLIPHLNARLSADGYLRTLRRGAELELLDKLEAYCPDHLVTPDTYRHLNEQLELFVA